MMKEVDNVYIKKQFFADIFNYVPLGSLFSAPECNTGVAFSAEFQEVSCLPISLAQFSPHSRHQILELCRKHLIRIFCREKDARLHTRFYVLPNDVGRSLLERHEKVQCLFDLIRHVDSSPQAWFGLQSQKKTTYDLDSKNSDSLFYIFNQLPSPKNSNLLVSCPYSNSAIQDVLDTGTLRGLKTSLYPYQKRTVATMIRREVQPGRMLDPRLQPLTGPTGIKFYLDSQAGCLLRDRREYDEACGGILGESMGLGKTLICLTTILSTRGHWPSIPPEYSLVRRPVRPHVASLMQTAAAAVAQALIPWKPYFHDLLASDENLANCRAQLAATAPYYEIPSPVSYRATRRPTATPQHRTMILSYATLVIVPQNLLSQWKGEIERHIEVGELVVLCLDTADTALMPSAEKLQQYDIILMTRQRLEREMTPTSITKTPSNHQCRCSFDPTCDCPNNFETVQYHCPLKDLHFLRVIMDEGHEFSSYGQRNKTYWALQQLHFDRKWIVSGTPSSGLIGVEVEAATSEAADAGGAQPRMNHAALLQHRRKETALAQERKDLEKLGGLVVGFLKLKPWANTGQDLALWSKLILPTAEGARRPTSLQQLLESLVVRHRIEDVEADLTLPPLYNRVVHLKPSWYDKISINLFVLALVTNFITSERKDEDYMFHPKNKQFLHSLIMNLRQANFYWTSWTPEQVEKTIQASRDYLEDHTTPGSTCSEQDRQLLEQGIEMGKIILQCKPWKLLSQVHEMGIFIEKFPEKARNAWTLLEQKGAEPLMSSATQMIKAQDWVDTQLNSTTVEGIEARLSDEGTKTTQKLWSAEEDKLVNRRVLTNRKPRPLGPAGIPQLTTKQTISPVKVSPKQSKIKDVFPTSKPGPGGRTPTKSKTIQPVSKAPDTPAAPAAPFPDCPLPEARIIGSTSTKLSYLLDQLVRLHTTEKILVFYEGDHIAYYIAQALELLSIRHLIYTGTLSSDRQSAYITTFNSTPTFRVLLMDVNYAAHGLHIASASRVFFVNPVWQPNVEAQAIKRAHRIGQSRPVYVETLVLEETFEDHMLQRRKGMTAEEHQKAEKSLLDDGTMSTIIKNANFTPFDEQEIQNVGHQIAMLQNPQQLFGRPDRPVGDVNDRDADLIFPNGAPKKCRKRKPQSNSAPDLPSSPQTPKKVIPGSISPLSSPLARWSSMMDTVMGDFGTTAGQSSSQVLPGSLPLRNGHVASDDSETPNAPGLFGGPMS